MTLDLPRLKELAETCQRSKTLAMVHPLTIFALLERLERAEKVVEAADKCGMCMAASLVTEIAPTVTMELFNELTDAMKDYDKAMGL